MSKIRLVIKEVSPPPRVTLIQLGIGFLGAVLGFFGAFALAISHWRESDIGIAGASDGRGALLGLCAIVGFGGGIVGALIGLLLGGFVGHRVEEHN